MMLTEDLPKYKHRPFQCGDFVKVISADTGGLIHSSAEYMRKKHLGEIGQVADLGMPEHDFCTVLMDDGYYVMYEEDEVEATGLPKGHLKMTLTVVPFPKRDDPEPCLK